MLPVCPANASSAAASKDIPLRLMALAAALSTRRPHSLTLLAQRSTQSSFQRVYMGSNTSLWRETESCHRFSFPDGVISIGASMSHISSAIFSIILDLCAVYNLYFFLPRFLELFDDLRTYADIKIETYLPQQRAGRRARTRALDDSTHTILRRLDPFVPLMPPVHEQSPLIILCYIKVYVTT